MRILTLTTKAHGGGAERVALDLAGAFAGAGHESHVRARADQPSEPPLVSPAPFDKRALSLGGKIEYYTLRAIQELGVELISAPTFPHLFNDLPFSPDVIHLHNFRENFLRLRDLEALCRRAPVVWTWHDMWPATGHCAHSLDCERWRRHCGRCPWPDAYVRLRFDFSRLNVERRRRLYRRIAETQRGRLHVVCPSEWLCRIAREGVAAPLAARRIPNGVDLGVFRPVTPERKAELRRAAGIDPEAMVVLYVAHSGRKNIYKDYETLDHALALLRAHKRNIVCIAVGDTDVAAPTWREGCELALGVVRERTKMAEAYAMADAYVHPARADTFPLTVLEALACGVPVVASAVCGLPEMVEHGETGLLAAAGDISSMVEAIETLAAQPSLRARMARRAAEVARARFDLTAVAGRYIEIFESLVGHTQ